MQLRRDHPSGHKLDSQTDDVFPSGSNEVAIVGTYAVGLQCFYCDFYIAGYRGVDHFQRNDQIKDPFRRNWKT